MFNKSVLSFFKTILKWSHWNHLETATKIPQKRPAYALKAELAERLKQDYKGEDGFDIGEPICPKKVKVLKINLKDRSVAVEFVNVSGRKRSLRAIRKELLEKQIRKGIVRWISFYLVWLENGFEKYYLI